MINSMTGFGEAKGEVNGISFTVEVKTVNNRYFKAIVKLPELAAFLEGDIEKLLRKNLSRGTVNYALRLKDVSANALFDIDEVALKAVVEKLRRAESSAGVRGAIDIANLLCLPGIIRPASPDKEMAEKIGIHMDWQRYEGTLSYYPSVLYTEVNPDTEFDMFVISFKDVLHTGSFTAENPWLDEISVTNPYTYNVMMNIEEAKRKGFREGDIICLENIHGCRGLRKLF